MKVILRFFKATPRALLFDDRPCVYRRFGCAHHPNLCRRDAEHRHDGGGGFFHAALYLHQNGDRRRHFGRGNDHRLLCLR